MKDKDFNAISSRLFTKGRVGAMAALLAIGMICGVTYAISVGMDSLGETGQSPKLVLHDDFDSPHKNVYVENADDDNYYVRIQLAEYMVISDTNKAVPSGAVKSDISTYKVKTSLAGNPEFNKYYVTSFGGTKKYIPLSAYAEDEYFTSDNAIQDTRTVADYNSAATKDDMINGNVISIDDYAPGYVGWVFDNDGWAYWSKPLNSGQTTNMLISDVTPTTDAWSVDDYALNVKLDFESADSKTPFETNEQTKISFAAKDMLGLATDSEYFSQLYNDAVTFSANHNLDLPLEDGITQADYLTFMYIRSFNDEYSTHQFNIVGGAVNSDFVDFVNNNDAPVSRYYSETINANGCDVRHQAYVMNSLMYKCADTMLTAEDMIAIGVPQDKVDMMTAFLPIQAGKLMTEKQYNDLSGWAGDLQTFTQYMVAQYPGEGDVGKIADNAKSDMGKEGTTFDQPDVNADLDAENIYNLLVGQSDDSLDSIYSDYYSNMVDRRASIFVNDKGQEVLSAEALAYTTQRFDLADSRLNLMVRLALGAKMPWPIYYKDNTTITTAQSQGIAQGFTDYINDMD